MNAPLSHTTLSASPTGDVIFGAKLNEIKAEQRIGALRGAQWLVKALQAKGVTVIFAYPGGANLEIFDALSESSIRIVRTEHEQGAIHAAQGYARVTGQVGVCLATSGPGATNLVTGIADANSDSIPIVAICGNVPSHLLGKNAFQEVDIVAITRPITKQSSLIRRVSDIPELVQQAFAVALGGRPGPVLLDIPKDIQQHYPCDAQGNYVELQLSTANTTTQRPVLGLNDAELAEALALINTAQKPVIYAGGGIISAAAESNLLSLAETLNCPVATTLMGQGIFPPGHDLALHALGMHGTTYANTAVNEADLVLALGVRFDDRVTGNVDSFIRHGKIIHIDIDKNELNKNKPATLAVCADLSTALQQLLHAIQPKQHSAWLSYLNDLKQQYPLSVPEHERISPQFAIAMLSDLTAGKAIVSLGVGQHQMWAMQHYRAVQTRSFLSSSGFGTMGYGLPAAIGAKVARPDSMVIDIDGDGSLNMTVHELATCHRYGIGVKVVVINNQWLGMVRQWQDMIYDKNRVATDLSDPQAVKAPGESAIYPDFVTIAQGYKVKSERVSDKAELAAAYARLLADPAEPYLLDIIVAAEENVYPMIPAGGSYLDVIHSEAELLAKRKFDQGANV